MLGTILLVVVVLLLIGGLPHWGFHNAGYGPSGLITVVLLILVVLLLTGRM